MRVLLQVVVSLFTTTTLLTVGQAFVLCPNSRTTTTTTTTTQVSMAPRFDKKTQKWYPTKADEGPEAGYPLVNTLLLHGPKPFLQRVFNKEDYEQAVLKFMAGDKCDRQQAMGNMDAYLNNANDWAYNRLAAEKEGGYQPDYVTLKKEAVALTLTWSAIVLTIASRVGWSLYTGNDFWQFVYDLKG